MCTKEAQVRDTSREYCASQDVLGRAVSGETRMHTLKASVKCKWMGARIACACPHLASPLYVHSFNRIDEMTPWSIPQWALARVKRMRGSNAVVCIRRSELALGTSTADVYLEDIIEGVRRKNITLESNKGRRSLNAGLVVVNERKNHWASNLPFALKYDRYWRNRSSFDIVKDITSAETLSPPPQSVKCARFMKGYTHVDSAIYHFLLTRVLLVNDGRRLYAYLPSLPRVSVREGLHHCPQMRPHWNCKSSPLIISRSRRIQDAAIYAN